MISEDMVQALKDAGVNLFSTLPCEKVRRFHHLVSANFRHISLSSEEEGVGISAGAYLAGGKPAMLVQSSGVGHMINDLCSLTKTYDLPLLVLVSWRGVYKEQIPAQVALGERLPRILSALDVDYSIIEKTQDASIVYKVASEVYRRNRIHAILLNPKVWEGEKINDLHDEAKTRKERPNSKRRISTPTLTRFEIIEAVAEFLEGKIVVCNLGVPCKELYRVHHQKSNFYMLGSMGLASSIGLGIALFTRKKVVVIDGDGSLLMSLGTLSTIAVSKPENLTVLAIDNGVHGSTGNQPTAASDRADLELIARASGFDETFKAANKEGILQTLRNLRAGPNFIHILARPGNAEVSNVPLTPLEIKQNVVEALAE